MAEREQRKAAASSLRGEGLGTWGLGKYTYNDLSQGHLKWWFSKGITPKSP